MTFILRKLYFMVGDENKSKLNILIKKHFLNTNLTPAFKTYHYLRKKEYYSLIIDILVYLNNKSILQSKINIPREKYNTTLILYTVIGYRTK